MKLVRVKELLLIFILSILISFGFQGFVGNHYPKGLEQMIKGELAFKISFVSIWLLYVVIRFVGCYLLTKIKKYWVGFRKTNRENLSEK